MAAAVEARLGEGERAPVESSATHPGSGRFGPAVVISILTRRLREGKTLEDFRAAWHRAGGFGVPTRVVTGQGLDDPREIVTVGFTDIELDEIEAFLERTAPEEGRRHERIADVIEPAMTRAFYVQVADDDLS